MKHRYGFVTNSSSTAFVVNLAKTTTPEEKERVKHLILSRCARVSASELDRMCDENDDSLYDHLYYLVDYKDGDDIMHVWVRRDEYVYDDDLDDALFKYDVAYDKPALKPAFDRHF